MWFGKIAGSGLFTLLVLLSYSCGSKVEFSDVSIRPNMPSERAESDQNRTDFQPYSDDGLPSPTAEVADDSESNAATEEAILSESEELEVSDESEAARTNFGSSGVYSDSAPYGSVEGAVEGIVGSMNAPTQEQAESLNHGELTKEALSDANLPTPGAEGTEGSGTKVPMMSVNELCHSLPKKKKNFDVVYAKKEFQCSWNQNGNFGAMDGIVRGRSEEKVSLALEPNETICGMSLSAPDQDVVFDDELLLTFNDVVLMSSYNYNSRFQTTDGLSKYNWLDLLDAFNPGAKNAPMPYCLGVAPNDLVNCTVPITQNKGRLVYNVPQEQAQKLSNIALRDRKLEIGLIVTGDDDKVDCQHSDLNLKVELLVVERE